MRHRINKEWEVIALEQLTSHIECRPTTKETGVAYDNSTWHAINTRCLLGGVYVPCIYRMSGGVIVGDSGLCCDPAFHV